MWDCKRKIEGPLILHTNVTVLKMSQFAAQCVFLTSLWLDTVVFFFVFFISTLCPPQMTHLYSNVGETAPCSSPAQLRLISSVTLAPPQPRPPRLFASSRLQHLFFFSPLPHFSLPPFFFLPALYLISKECWHESSFHGNGFQTASASVARRGICASDCTSAGDAGVWMCILNRGPRCPYWNAAAIVRTCQCCWQMIEGYWSRILLKIIGGHFCAFAACKSTNTNV